ncbi:hypothetical protein [Stutzerimonas kirkiae]|uniref:Uncharacterized protein n=1 Tax=Stutzerimonas kirkiae TaxID=2211392 RepID=A0A4Q9RBH2_9GAMM|nr:hypothetical protein [Stutzerimonas kirkiae]TBU98252.1 hypothetical protein DNJ96_05540 [Stutzerimonas kirkiae]TBV00926.1 hypothetical protein DNJ95_13410 [Stutzerimonas kirkiae]TBV07738.1 hypothetical protein DNK08_11965 [Stutzerimonas kirkiae]TBV16632.1 hypothetical protein DNK01_01835 [Stutzerimonas kirkiae]
MSTLLIAGLVLAALFLLLLIGYASQLVEKRGLEKARLRADLKERVKRCSELNANLPGQLMSPALKRLLYKIELGACQRLQALEKSPPQLTERIQALDELLRQGEEVPVENPPAHLSTEQHAKAAREMLENVHAQIVHAAKDGVIPRDAARHWTKEIKKMLVLLYIDYFNAMGTMALQQGQYQKARLAFERGVQYVRKQPDAAQYSAQLRQLQERIGLADSQVQKRQPTQTEDSELSEGMKSFSDDDWKKKNIY